MKLSKFKARVDENGCLIFAPDVQLLRGEVEVIVLKTEPAQKGLSFRKIKTLPVVVLKDCLGYT